MMERVYDRAVTILEEIEILKANLKINDLSVMAVTKNQPVEKIEQARKAGFRLFGENRVQEFLLKEDYFKTNNLEVHLIGHLQTNKVKLAVGRFTVIESVDSISIANAIDKEAKKQNIVQDIYLEVNIGNEENKYGFSKDELLKAVEIIKDLTSVRVCGLMAIPPITTNEEIREYFSLMKALFIDIINKKIDNIYMNVLSIGMSSDYIIAIEEGSRLVRIGTAIFG